MLEIIAIIFIVMTVLVLALIFEVFIFYTGELVLYALTVGKRQPTWDFMAYEKDSRFTISRDPSTIVGIAFWIVLITFCAFIVAGI